MPQRKLKREEKKLIRLIENAIVPENEDRILKHLHKKIKKPTSIEMSKESPVEFLNDTEHSDYLSNFNRYNFIISKIVENGYYNLFSELAYTYEYAPYNLNIYFHSDSENISEKQLIVLKEWLKKINFVLVNNQERVLPDKKNLYFIWKCAQKDNVNNFKKEVQNLMKTLMINVKIDEDFVVEWLRFLYDNFEIASFKEDAWKIIREYRDIFSSPLRNDMELFNKCASLVMKKANKGNGIKNPFYYFFRRPNKKGMSAISLLEKEGRVGVLAHLESLEEEKNGFKTPGVDVSEMMKSIQEKKNELENTDNKAERNVEIVRHCDFKITKKGRLVVKKENKINTLNLYEGHYCYEEKEDCFMFYKEGRQLLHVSKRNFKDAAQINEFREKVESALMNENDADEASSSYRIIENNE